MNPPAHRTTLPVTDYDLAVTLGSGQTFRWKRDADGWTGVIGCNWVRLRQTAGAIHAVTAKPQDNWMWLTDYLQTEVDLKPILDTFPRDECFTMAVPACRGLRLLKQPFWECLVSFILSSTKQIVQIEQIVARLCERYGEAIATPDETLRAYAFPKAHIIARLSEDELRQCKMGFRAKYLREAARLVMDGRLDESSLRRLSPEEARNKMMELPGVGPKIADCVLLFTGHSPSAFPVDVWVAKALRRYYFQNQAVSAKTILQFTREYFGPHAGYAQQYLFHYMRTTPRGRGSWARK